MASVASPAFRVVSISSMIVELANTVSSRVENIEGSTYQSTLFPEPAATGESRQSPQKSKRWATTDVSRGSIKESSVRILSIPRACYLERSTSQSRYVAIRVRCCNFSTDQVEKANFECLAEACHLPSNPSESKQQGQP